MRRSRLRSLATKATAIIYIYVQTGIHFRSNEICDFGQALVVFVLSIIYLL